MPRTASKPIPKRIQSDFFTAMWDLAWHGRFYRAIQPNEFSVHQSFFYQFGAVTDVSRRHGLVVLWSTAAALRFNELARLRLSDVDAHENTVYVARSKKSKSETIHVDSMLVKCTAAWHRRVKINSVLLLPNQHGRKLNNKIFNRDVCEPLGEIFGIQLSHHSFRDTACDLGFGAGGDARAVQRLLGHKSAQTTQIYAEKSAPAPIQIPLFAGDGE